MNIVFLDMDGVVNSDEFLEKWFESHTRDEKSYKEFSSLYCIHDGHNGYVVPELVERFKDICEKTDSMIVWSSSWRENYLLKEIGVDDFLFDLDEIRSLWKAKGLPVERFIGCTPCFNLSRYSYVPRGCEIQSWIYDHENQYEIEKVAILDDNDDADVGVTYDNARFFQTTFRHGLTSGIANDIISWMTQS